MFLFPRFGRRPALTVKPTVHDLAPDTDTLVEERPTLPPLSLDRLIPEEVDPDLLRVRENLDGE